MSRPEPLALAAASFHVRELHLRLPFRFGMITLTEVPLLHLAVVAEAPDGRRVRGFAADNLVPKWFDKSPWKSGADNVRDLLLAARDAHEAYAQAARRPATVWEIWRAAYPECRRRGAERGLDGLVASFGSSLFERALADCAGRLAGADVVEMLRADVLGLRPGEIHRELAGPEALGWASAEPLPALAVRHTVGLLDPITAADVAPGGADDGLPRTLEEYVALQDLRHFKLKVGGDARADLDRLRRIAEVLDRLVPGPYVVTLDGNEQYRSIERFRELVDAVWGTPALHRLARSTAFIEQPLERAIALDADATRGLAELSRRVPLIIDESDGDLDAFRRAVEVGYRGVSTKNCKGIVKSFLNRSLVDRLNRERPPDDRLFMSAEDLTNVPVVPVQQDLATVRALGIPHVERNGHHYVRGLAHCSRRERADATRLHPDLYAGDEAEAWLRIEDGRLAVASLRTPGYGVAFDPDLEAMTPLEQWRPPATADPDRPATA
jgi:hypothetical protein